MQHLPKNMETGNRSLRSRLKRYRVLYLMLLPSIITVFIFHYIPFYGVIMAFKDYRPSLGIFGSKWVGLKHFVKFVQYPYFWRILRNTLKLNVYSFITFPLPIVFALLLNEMRSLKFKNSIQMIAYAPHFVSTVVVCSMTLLFIKEGGPFNTVLKLFGGTPKEWIAEPDAFVWIYITSGLWQGLGWGTIIYTSSLAGVSSDIVDAAKVDGAGRLRVIRHIYLPHLVPVIVITLILRMGTLLSVGFEKIFLLQNPLNMEVSTVISTYAYSIGIVGGQYSYSTAVGLFNNIISVILVFLTNRISKRVSGNQFGL